jgi:hypothetical protein
VADGVKEQLRLHYQALTHLAQAIDGSLDLQKQFTQLGITFNNHLDTALQLKHKLEEGKNSLRRLR